MAACCGSMVTVRNLLRDVFSLLKVGQLDVERVFYGKVPVQHSVGPGN